MTSILYRVAVSWLVCAGLAAQQRSVPALCPTLLGIYPVDFKIDEPLKQRPRFEIRFCNDGSGLIQLLAFKSNANTPSWVEAGSHVNLLIQTGTLIVVEMTAGSSSPTLVAQFQKGVPKLLGREDGVGGVTYSEDHKGSDYAIITIPQKTFPVGVGGKFPDVPPHQYRLKIWED